MLHTLLRVHKIKPFSRAVLPTQSPVAQPQESGCTSILKIVHAGGHVESYYIAIPAATILKKYPSFLLARPAVFINPWDSVVRADEILTPGEKLLLVPHRTVRKLRRKIRRPLKEFSVNSDNFFVSQSSVDVSDAETISQRKQGAAVSGEISDSSICSIIGRKTSVVCKKHVTFSGIDIRHKYKSGDQIEHSRETSTSVQARRGKSLTKRRVRSAMTWQPSLTAITETQGSDHVLKP